MTKDLKKQLKDAVARKRTDPFGGLKGERFGGGSNRLIMEVGDVAGPLRHVKIDPNVKLTQDTEPVDIYIAANGDGEELRMPAATVFRKNAELAELKPGDTYHVAREADAIKKAGKGKGRPMEVYTILVTKRV
jgi:hypothetical protein